MISSTLDKTFTVVASLRSDNMLRFYSVDSEERKKIAFTNIRPRREDRWANYIKAAVFTFLGGDYEFDHPLENGGINFTIKTTIPKHKQFGALPALELASALAIRPFFAPEMTDGELLSKLAEAHKEFFEREIDVVDFFVMMGGEQNKWTITREDELEDGIAATKNIEAVFEGYKTYLIDARVPLFDPISEAEKRKQQLVEGLDIISKKNRGANFLSHGVLEMLETDKDIKSEEMRRRCLHTAQEALRLASLEDALKTHNTAQTGKIFFASHASLRDMYETTCPEIDWLVRRAEAIKGVVGARMLGVGFGTTIFVIMNDEAEKEFDAKLEDYERIFGFRPVKHELYSGGAASHIGMY